MKKKNKENIIPSIENALRLCKDCHNLIDQDTSDIKKAKNKGIAMLTIARIMQDKFEEIQEKNNSTSCYLCYGGDKVNYWKPVFDSKKDDSNSDSKKDAASFFHGLNYHIMKKTFGLVLKSDEKAKEAKSYDELFR